MKRIPNMLTVDIETTGLEPTKSQIVLACAYDGASGFRRCYHFMKDPATRHSEGAALLHDLDHAESLCFFNGVRFDIPFIAHHLGVDVSRQGAWVAKTFDYFEICKLCFGSSCSLDRLLACNGFERKTADGKTVLQWVEEERWDDIEEYCMQDVIKTYNVSCAPRVMIPLTGWQHPVYFHRELYGMGNPSDLNVRQA